MRVDLKALLLISTSASPDTVIRMHKRFRVGRVSYLMRYELQNGELIIRQLKKVRPDFNLASQSRKRMLCLKRMLEAQNTLVETGSQTSLHSNSIAVGTEVLLANTASQTAQQECSSIQLDTMDLTLTQAKDQQTRIPEFQSSLSQTEDQTSQSRTTQAKVAAKTWSTQTRLRSATLASQTETLSTNACVQSEMTGQHEVTQTEAEVEEQLMKPYLQALIHESLKGMSQLIHKEVRAAVSQVLDISQLELRKTRQEQDLPREGALEPLSSLPIDQIGDKLPSEKPLTMEDLMKVLTKSALKPRLIKAKKFSAGHSWNCTMKCKRCGLHMHRSRLRLPIDSQSTQTEEDEQQEEMDNEQKKPTKVSAEMATQTEKLEKERGRWTLKRN